MRNNKYSSDYKLYSQRLNQSEFENNQNLVENKQINSISLDIWDKKYRVTTNNLSDFVTVRGDVKLKPQSLNEFALFLNLPIELVIEQFKNAGVSNLNSDALITERHKTALLEYLRAEHGVSNKGKILLTRKRVILHEDEKPQKNTIILLQDVNDELLFYLAKNPELIYKLDSRKFEQLIAKLFADRGHEVSLTKSTRDGGYDIFARVKDAFSSFIILVECKKYSAENKVGVEVVRGLYGVTEAHKANQGLIITSSYFTKGAQQEQLRIGNRIGLKDYNDLVEWINPYSKQS